MRWFVGIFGIVAGALAVAIVARYGYSTADTHLDGMITGSVFALIAVGGLVGHAVAVRVWRNSKVAAVFVGLVAFAALLVSLTNSLGFVVGRDTKTAAVGEQTRMALRKQNAMLDDAIRERRAMTFTPTTETAVAAARSAVDSATRTREIECKSRGRRCRAREADEKSSRDKLVEITSQSALTAQASGIDARIERLQSKISATKPPTAKNPQATALAQLLNLPATTELTVGTYARLAVAIILELLVVAAFVTFEMMRPQRTPKAVAVGDVAEPTNSETALALTPLVDFPRPTLIASNELPTMRVADFLADSLHPQDGSDIDLDDIISCYRAACESSGMRPASRTEVRDVLSVFVREFHIQHATNGNGITLRDVTIMNETRKAL